MLVDYCGLLARAGRNYIYDLDIFCNKNVKCAKVFRIHHHGVRDGRLEGAE